MRAGLEDIPGVRDCLRPAIFPSRLHLDRGTHKRIWEWHVLLGLEIVHERFLESFFVAFQRTGNTNDVGSIIGLCGWVVSSRVVCEVVLRARNENDGTPVFILDFSIKEVLRTRRGDR